MLKQLCDKTILYLEDDDEILKSAGKIFAYLVKHVHKCSTLDHAIRTLNEHRIDIIIADLMLNGISSLPFIEEIRKKYPLLPIIVVSGYKNEDILLRVIPLRLTSYIVKPIQFDQLLDALTLCSNDLLLLPKEDIQLNNGFHYNKKQSALMKQGIIYSLTQQENRFIELLSHNQTALITKDMIRSYVWNENEDYVSEQMIANLLMRIRKRFGKSFIYTIRDLGYRLKR